MTDKKEYKESIDNERLELLIEIDSIMDKPLIILAFIWLGIIIVDFTTGLTTQLLILNYAIWAIFILDFLIGLIIAPIKSDYLKSNWIIGLSVILPAFGILRLFRAARLLRFSRFIRSVNLLRLLASMRRGISALKNILKSHGLGYIITITIILIFTGAAGMAYFESPEAVNQSGNPNATGLASYWDALWWTVMIMTTMGSQYWPVTVEGRTLGILLALYAFIFFGYIAANIASNFIKPIK